MIVANQFPTASTVSLNVGDVKCTQDFASYTTSPGNLHINSDETPFPNAYYLGWIAPENTPSTFTYSDFKNEEGTAESLKFTPSTRLENHNICYTAYNSGDYWGTEGGIINQYSDDINDIEEKWKSFSTNGTRSKVMLNQFYIGIINMSHLEVRYSWCRSEENQDSSGSLIFQINAEDFETWKNQKVTLQIENTDVEVDNAYLNENFYQDVLVNNHIYHVFISDYGAVLGGLVDSDGSAIASNRWNVMPTIQTYATGSKPEADPGTTYHEILTAAQNAIYTLPSSGGGFSAGYYNLGEFDFYNHEQYALSPGDRSNANYFRAIANGFDCEIPDYVSRFRQSRLWGSPVGWFPYGNAMWHLRGANWTTISRMYQPNDIILHMSLLPRWKAKRTDPNTFNLVDGVYYPEVTTENEFTGRLITGTANELLQKLRPWQYGSITENEYDSEEDLPPYTPGEDESDDPKGPPNSGVGGDGFRPGTAHNLPSQRFINYGAFEENGLAALSAKLWNQPDNFFESLSASQKVNPMDYFISLRFYPFNFYDSSNTKDVIYLGRGGAIQSASMTYTPYAQPKKQWSTKRLRVEPYYNNFLDYAPYTKIFINLPFCGQYELNSTLIMGKELMLGITVDFTEGNVVYIVDVIDGNSSYPILQKQGKIGADIPISGVNSSQMGANIVNATLNTAGHLIEAPGKILSGATNAIIGAETGSAANIASSIQTLGGLGLQALGDCHAMGMASKEIIDKIMPCSGYAAASEYVNSTPFIIYQRPICENPSSFGHTIGYLVNKKAKIEDVSGFTVCKNPDLSGISSATDKELKAIKDLLESGFYA